MARRIHFKLTGPEMKYIERTRDTPPYRQLISGGTIPVSSGGKFKLPSEGITIACRMGKIEKLDLRTDRGLPRYDEKAPEFKVLDKETSISLKNADLTKGVSIMVGRLGKYLDRSSDDVVLLGNPEMVQGIIARAIDDYREGLVEMEKEGRELGDLAMMACRIILIKYHTTGFHHDDDKWEEKPYIAPGYALVTPEKYRTVSAATCYLHMSRDYGGYYSYTSFPFGPIYAVPLTTVEEGEKGPDHLILGNEVDLILGSSNRQK